MGARSASSPRLPLACLPACPVFGSAYFPSGPDALGPCRTIRPTCLGPPLPRPPLWEPVPGSTPSSAASQVWPAAAASTAPRGLQQLRPASAACSAPLTAVVAPSWRWRCRRAVQRGQQVPHQLDLRLWVRVWTGRLTPGQLARTCQACTMHQDQCSRIFARLRVEPSAVLDCCVA